jgi:hypothetical protein
LRVRKENSAFKMKASLRLQARRLLSEPITMLETHGGSGHLWRAVFPDVEQGVVLDNDARKCEALSQQRPTWSVYEADSAKALAAGVGKHLRFNLIDADPFGDPWPTIEAIFRHERPLADVLALTVNDGLHRKLRLQGAWSIRSMAPVVQFFGNHDLHTRYLDICRWNMERLVALARYRVRHWTAYYCGDNNCLTHYAALLERTP